MKTAVIVGLFVLVACPQFQSANGIACEGEPEGGWIVCRLHTCNEATGQYMITRCEDVIPRCTGRAVHGFIEADFSKSFPDCCARPICRYI